MPMIELKRIDGGGAIYLNIAAIEVISTAPVPDACTVELRGYSNDDPVFFHVEGTAAQVAARINDAERRAGGDR